MNVRDNIAFSLFMIAALFLASEAANSVSIEKEQETFDLLSTVLEIIPSESEDCISYFALESYERALQSLSEGEDYTDIEIRLKERIRQKVLRLSIR